MNEYIENGARLAWLLDPLDKAVYVYRPGMPVQILDRPQRVSADPELPQFAFDVAAVFDDDE